PHPGLPGRPVGRRDRAPDYQPARQRQELDPPRADQPQAVPVLGAADRVNIRNPELVDRLAAEYALGTLRGRARRHFERWLVSPQVSKMVSAWEDRLAGLEPRMERVTPSATVWQGIERRLELRARRAAPGLRWLAIAASLVFFAVMGWLVVYRPAGVTTT